MVADQSAVIGLGNRAQTTANLLRERECVLNLVPSALVDVVDRIALTTGRDPVPDGKRAQGYRYDADKFATGGVTRQSSDLVTPPRIRECPIQLECTVRNSMSIGGREAHATTFELEVVRAHVDASLVIPGTHYVDPIRWDPLIMKFCEFFGDGDPVHTSRLSGAWRMPHGDIVSS